jgi:hypothetical protein
MSIPKLTTTLPGEASLRKATQQPFAWMLGGTAFAEQVDD